MPEYCRITIDVPFTEHCNAAIVVNRLLDKLYRLQRLGRHCIDPSAPIDFDISWLSERDPLTESSAQQAMHEAAKAARENLEKLDVLQRGEIGQAHAHQEFSRQHRQQSMGSIKSGIANKPAKFTGRIHIDNHGKELLIDVRDGLIEEVICG